MCFSAQVEMDLKKLAKKFGAEIDLESFLELFTQRLNGSGAKISRALEIPFLNPQTPAEKKIAKAINDFNQLEESKREKDLFAQKKRLADAERLLKTKVTKKAENDKRIATDKIEKIKSKLDRLKVTKVSENDGRIFPYGYAPLIVMENGHRLIRPFRYLMRPSGQEEDFDRKFGGCYNARLDGLDSKFFWKSVLGKNHGVMVVKSFWENVSKHTYERRKPRAGEEDENIVLHFSPKGLDQMIVPCIFDHNEEGEFPLDSFALITDDPNPEVKAAGHDRTPVFMKEEYIDQWLKHESKSLKDYGKVFADKQKTYFEHEVAA